MQLLLRNLEISRFYERFNDFANYIIVHKICEILMYRESNYSGVITYSKFPDHFLQSYVNILKV